MKVSQIGLIQTKLTSLDEQFPVQDMLLRTGQITQFSSGIYAYGHIPYLVKAKIDQIISETLTKYGASRLSLPTIQPENIWIESGRLNKYIEDDVMFRILTDKGNYCMAPTAEEAIVTYAKLRLSSYKQLPVTYFQIGEKFRKEIRTRGYLLRGKSFDMMDAYSFGKNQEDLDIEYDRMKQAYLDIFETLGLDVFPVGADNGSIGGSRSEEFMCLSEIGEDKILVDENTNKALNTELLEREDAKEYLKNTYDILDTNSLITKRAVELGHIFQLGDKYAKTMNATFIDKDNKPKNFVMGCYGIGVSRTLAMVYEKNILKDEKGTFQGVSLPLNLAPYIIYMIPKTDDKEKYDFALDIYNQLIDLNVPILFDDRKDLSIGAKLKDAKMLGIPYVSVFGKTLDNDEIEIENNKTGNKITLPITKFNEKMQILSTVKDDNITLEEIIKNN